jgi:hypothetical protein
LDAASTGLSEKRRARFMSYQLLFESYAFVVFCRRRRAMKMRKKRMRRMKAIPRRRRR